MSNDRYNDLIDRLAAYRPGDLEHEWTPERRAEVRNGLLDDLVTRPPRVRFVPRRLGVPAPALAAAAVVALIGGVLVAVTASGSDGGDGGGSQQPGGAVHLSVPANLSDTSDVGPAQFSYRVNEQIELDANGNAVPGAKDAMIDRSYVATNGDVVSIRTGSQTGCTSFPRTGEIDLGFPTRELFASMPTDVDALSQYLDNAVHGSSSHDEAVFVVVGDALRTADALASPRLRAAMVAVLSRTPGVYVHENDQDHLGRPAIRLDFVSQRIRPGEIHSYYFDPTTYQFLQERFGSNGEPSSYDGPSPAYSAHADEGVAPRQLTGKSFIIVMNQESVVDTLPAAAQHCPHG